MSEKITEGLTASEEDAADTLPYFYINGFEINISLSDISITLMTSSRRRYRMLLSFTSAKTLLVQLKQTFDIIEKHTDQPILTMKEVKAGMDSATKSKEAQ